MRILVMLLLLLVVGGCSRKADSPVESPKSDAEARVEQFKRILADPETTEKELIEELNSGLSIIDNWKTILEDPNDETDKELVADIVESYETIVKLIEDELARRRK